MFTTAWDGGLERRAGTAAVGIDVGGTKVGLGLLDAHTLELHDAVRLPSAGGGEDLLARVRDEAARLAARAAAGGRQVVGAGLGVPEIVSLDGRITSSAVIDGWDRLPVEAVLGAIAPLRVESDVRAAALAEAVLGEGARFDYFLYFIVGTGISYCAVLGGRPLAGAHGGALNIGTSTLAMTDEGGPVLERVASGSALVERYRAGGGDAERAEEVLVAARGGGDLAAAVVDEGAAALGMAVALLVNVLDPQALVFGGGLGSSRGGYIEQAMRHARPHMYSDAARAIPAYASRLGPDGGVIGAAMVGLLRA